MRIADYIELLEFKANRSSLKRMVFPKTPVLKDLESLFVQSGFRKVRLGPGKSYKAAMESLLSYKGTGAFWEYVSNRSEFIRFRFPNDETTWFCRTTGDEDFGNFFGTDFECTRYDSMLNCTHIEKFLSYNQFVENISNAYSGEYDIALG